ncbi:glycosyltransferase [Listeria weihenstephanensis]|uniref:Glycosyltransferase n=1 Tax=Listeria weihenstephanensis TaxID=1006155 RepID=A0A841Z2Q1_9LIST|nr:glycosyltransferase [Listeria weihenstephanensis]MBC1499189.1 glycosyltransferase [Listeria weihenstephanensis]
MIDIKSLCHDIEAVQKQILDDINPNIIAKEKLNDIEEWHSPSEQLITYEQNESMYVSSSSEGFEYLTFLENNNVFTRKPEFEITVLPKEELALTFEAETMGKVSAKLALIEYNSEAKKCKASFFDPNKMTTVILSPETTQIRVALKITHAGVVIVKKVQLERVIRSYTTKSTVSQVVDSNEPAWSVDKMEDLQIACIFDEFTRTCYEKEVNLISFTPDNWREVLEKTRPHFLFVESAWRGNGGAWEYKIAKYNNQSKDELHELLHWCQEQGIPTVFWNKEDPIHFDKFIETAERFDYIYTTDADMIPKYQERAGHKNVFAQPFAAQPSMHNPIQLEGPRIDKMCFAGSYYGNRHEERRKDMEDVLDVAMEYGLAVYDRNHGKNLKDKAMFEFPDRYQPAVLGSLAYSDMALAYKGYKYMININSIKYSPTMFSRRVFEGLASGTPVLSSYSKGIKRIFGNLVMISEDTENLRQQVQAITKDEHLYQQKSMAGIREVYREHTYQHRLASMLINMGVKAPNFKKSVAVIAIVHSKEEFQQVKQQFERQGYEDKQLVIFTGQFDEAISLMNQYNTGNIRVFTLSYMNHYQKIQDVIDADYMTYFATQHFYGKHYLEDLVYAAIYSKADFVGKGNVSYRYVTELQFHSSLVATGWSFGKTALVLLLEMEQNASLGVYLSQGARLFSSDRYNFLRDGWRSKNDKRRLIEI